MSDHSQERIMGGMNDREIAWAAGFYEGEGSFGVKRNVYGHPTALRLDIGQRNDEPLLRFLSIVGVGKLRHRHLGEGRGKEVWYYIAGKTENSLLVARLMWEDLSERRKLQIATAVDEFLSVPHRIDYADAVAFCGRE